jgi:hypothetical protein
MDPNVDGAKVKTPTSRYPWIKEIIYGFTAKARCTMVHPGDPKSTVNRGLLALRTTRRTPTVGLVGVLLVVGCSVRSVCPVKFLF